MYNIIDSSPIKHLMHYNIKLEKSYLVSDVTTMLIRALYGNWAYTRILDDRHLGSH
jgi:hypothetical protein